MLNEERLKEIVNCLLAQISDYSDMNKETYLSWLRTEVGISEEELSELNKEGYLPMPVTTELEME